MIYMICMLISTILGVRIDSMEITTSNDHKTSESIDNTKNKHHTIDIDNNHKIIIFKLYDTDRIDINTFKSGMLGSRREGEPRKNIYIRYNNNNSIYDSIRSTSNNSMIEYMDRYNMYSMDEHNVMDEYMILVYECSKSSIHICRDIRCTDILTTFSIECNTDDNNYMSNMNISIEIDNKPYKMYDRHVDDRYRLDKYNMTINKSMNMRMNMMNMNGYIILYDIDVVYDSSKIVVDKMYDDSIYEDLQGMGDYITLQYKIVCMHRGVYDIRIDSTYVDGYVYSIYVHMNCTDSIDIQIDDSIVSYDIHNDYIYLSIRDNKYETIYINNVSVSSDIYTSIHMNNIYRETYMMDNTNVSYIRYMCDDTSMHSIDVYMTIYGHSIHKRMRVSCNHISYDTSNNVYINTSIILSYIIISIVAYIVIVFYYNKLIGLKQRKIAHNEQVKKYNTNISNMQ